MSPACRPLWSSESICSTAVPNRSAKAMLAVFLTVKSLSQSASDRSKRLISSALKRPAASVATRRILESEFSLAPATTDAARGDDLTSHAGAGSALFNALVRSRSASSSVKPNRLAEWKKQIDRVGINQQHVSEVILHRPLDNPASSLERQFVSGQPAQDLRREKIVGEFDPG